MVSQTKNRHSYLKAVRRTDVEKYKQTNRQMDRKAVRRTSEKVDDASEEEKGGFNETQIEGMYGMVPDMSEKSKERNTKRACNKDKK